VQAKDLIMKIGNVAPGTPMDRSISPSKNNPTPTGFDQVFNETLQRHDGVKGKPAAVLQLPAVMPCGLKTIDSADAVPGVQVMENFIDALEGYQQQLGNSSICLRDIAPSLERLEKAHRHLAHFASEAPVDSPLGNIMNEGLVTATMEIQRFHSGVYC
jgi:hypothetical protein